METENKYIYFVCSIPWTMSPTISNDDDDKHTKETQAENSNSEFDTVCHRHCIEWYTFVVTIRKWWQWQRRHRLQSNALYLCDDYIIIAIKNQTNKQPCMLLYLSSINLSNGIFVSFFSLLIQHKWKCSYPLPPNEMKPPLFCG